MTATNFNTKNDTFRKLMGNGLTYRIPRFQRDYSWTEQEWEDLWMDVLGTIRRLEDYRRSYILCEIEKQMGASALDFDSDSFNLEHILPENPEDGWDAFPDEDLETFVFRLGNLTLLAKGANKDLGNQPYATKRPVFAESSFELTKKIANENADWTPERLAARQT